MAETCGNPGDMVHTHETSSPMSKWSAENTGFKDIFVWGVYASYCCESKTGHSMAMSPAYTSLREESHR